MFMKASRNQGYAGFDSTSPSRVQVFELNRICLSQTTFSKALFKVTSDAMVTVRGLQRRQEIEWDWCLNLLWRWRRQSLVPVSSCYADDTILKNNGRDSRLAVFPPVPRSIPIEALAFTASLFLLAILGGAGSSSLVTAL